MFRKEKQVNWIALRIYLMAIFFAIATVALTARAYRLQVSDSDWLKKMTEKQRTRVIHLEARRGTIYDKSGEALAVSLEVNSIYAKPKKVTDKKETAKKLAEILEMEPKDIMSKLSEDKTFVWIQRRVSPLTAEKVKRADLAGILTGPEYQRFYPYKGFAAHMIGFAGLDSSGLEGAELFYDKELKADSIPITAQRDALGRPVMFSAVGRDPKRRDIHLTLDGNIQHIAEKELAEAVEKEKAKSGIAVVLDADTGEIPALAVYPTYNLNTFHKVSADVRRNRAVADLFEPGSTFKVFLAAAALDLEKVTLDEIFDCHHGVYKFNGSEIHDVAPYKNLTFQDVIIHSSNIGAVMVSEKLKKTEFYRALDNFGFGTLCGVDLPGERPGVLPLPGKWSLLTKGNIAFGQGITVNAVQLCAGFAAAINGGILYRPHTVSAVTNAFGEPVIENPKSQVRRVIKESTSQQVVDILRQVVTRGTGKAAAIPTADIVGKTGTAQKAEPSGGYSQDKYVVSFIGAIMDIKPRLVIFVALDEPAGKGRVGGKAAAPVFRRIAEGILALCGSKPLNPELILATGSLPKKHITPVYKSLHLKRGKPGEWIVPDFKGLDMRQVMEVCGKMKCDVTFQGAGFVVDQNPKPGSVLKEGAAMTVSFEGRQS